MELDGILNYPVEEDGEYLAFIKYLETKKSEKAKKLLRKLKSLKTSMEYAYLKDYLLFDLFIEIFQGFDESSYSAD